MIRYHANWLLPITSTPIRNGWVAVEHGRVLAFGQNDGPGKTAWPSMTTVDLGAVVVLPGLVNAHTHLELSWLRGRVPSAPSMPAWVRTLVAVRRQAGDDDRSAIAPAINEALACGTVAVGDVSNTMASFELLALSRLDGVVFNELLAFNPSNAKDTARAARDVVERLPVTARLRASLAAHAPYSVSAPLFRAIRSEADHLPGVPYGVHLAESRDEIEFLQTGGGAWRALLEDFGAWNDSWTPPSCSPVEYLDRLSFLGRRTIVAHGVHLANAELSRLAECGATLVSCPRSNRWTGAGIPPIERFYASGLRVAFGTDSLASVADLNLFSELAAARRLAPGVAARRLLESATRHGAEALGFDDLGAIEPGRRARLIAISTPGSMDDVEEYLVNGIEPAQVRWLDDETVPG